jgi:hypothetical protein
MSVVERPGGTKFHVPEKPAALTTQDFQAPPEKPLTPREERIKTAEARVAEAEARVAAQEPFVPDALSAELKAAQDELSEIKAAEEAVDRSALDEAKETAAGIEELQEATINALRAYCDLREQLAERRESHDQAWRRAMGRGLEPGGRVLPVQVAAARDGDLERLLQRVQFWTNRAW